MKKAVIVFAHPNHCSLNGTIYNKIKDKLNQKEISITTIDLYNEQFNPVLSKQELLNYDQQSTDLQVKGYVNCLVEANFLIFIYPIWWYRGPAIFEGFLDRIFTKETAFSYKNGYHQPLFTNIESALILTTSAQTTKDMKDLFASPIENSLIKGTLKFVGIENAHWQNLELSENCNEKKLNDHLQKCYSLIDQNIK